MSTSAVLPSRSEIDDRYKWNAASVFDGPDAWNDAYTETRADVLALERFQGHLADGPGVLTDWFEARDDLFRRVYRLYVYATMSQACDTNDQDAGAMAEQARGLHGLFSGATAFAQPEILDIGRATLDDWLSREPRLGAYAHYLDDLFRQQPHVRSHEVEEVLGMVRTPFSAVEATARILTNAEIVFEPAGPAHGEPIPIGQGNIQQLLSSPDRALRRSAWENYADGYLAFQNTLASNFGAAIKQDVFMARARRFDSALEAALFEDNIPVDVFHNLVATTREHLPLWHRYWAVRRRALGVDALHPYDIWAPLTTAEADIPYEEAVDWIAAGMAPLGDGYADVLRRACLEEGWVDVYPNRGKRQGAFSTGGIGTHPFIMMSYARDLKSLSTLAHELGHSMHSYFTARAQPIVYTPYSLFVAEVASNFNQAMVRAHLLATHDDPLFQIALIEEAMSNFHRYFFIMPMLARFELIVHERAARGEPLPAGVLNAIMADLFAEGYGDEMTFDRDRVGITWSQFGHLYVPFYTFQYATGISGAHALARRVLDGEPGAADAYLDFLRTGSSKYPLDALRDAGVDLTTPEPVEAAFDVLAGYVDRLEALVDEAGLPEKPPAS
jgi:oligoendopeptidase F